MQIFTLCKTANNYWGEGETGGYYYDHWDQWASVGGSCKTYSYQSALSKLDRPKFEIIWIIGNRSDVIEECQTYTFFC